jgi:hypothetical protein
MDGRLEGSLDLGHIAAERNPCPAAGDFVDREALRDQPAGDVLYVLLAKSETVTEFLRREP